MQLAPRLPLGPTRASGDGELTLILVGVLPTLGAVAGAFYAQNEVLVAGRQAVLQDAATKEELKVASCTLSTTCFMSSLVARPPSACQGGWTASQPKRTSSRWWRACTS